MVDKKFNLLFLFLFSSIAFSSFSHAGSSRCEDMFDLAFVKGDQQQLRNELTNLQSDLVEAKKSNKLSLVNTGSVVIKGKLGEVLQDQNGQVNYLRFVGETELLDTNLKVLPGQGKDIHRDGYSTAIGSIKQILINGNEVQAQQIRIGDFLEIVYESGIRTQGKVKTVDRLSKATPQVLTLVDCTVQLGTRILYKPAFGPYDLILAEQINEVDVLPEVAHIDSKTLSTFYKTDVSQIRQDGLAFYNSVLERFSKQKDSGKDPYEFSFEEGRGVVEYMKAEIQSRISKYETEGLFWRPFEKKKLDFLNAFKLNYFAKIQKARLESELAFLKSVQADLLELESQKSITYRSLLYRSYDFLLVMQGTQIKNDAPFRTYIYEFYHKTTVKNLKALFEDYKSGNLHRYGESRYSFAVTKNEIFNPEKLEVVILPVVGFLLSSDLIANRNVPIHYATVNGVEAKADGFIQDPLTLYMHDIKFHAGQRELHDSNYFTEMAMSEKDILEFRRQQKIWIDDFIASYKKITDQKMRTAIVQAAQTITHDRGKVFAPSTFNEHQWRNLYFVMKGEVYVTVWGQPNKGIGQTYGEILPYMSDAYDWINHFWLKYKDSKY